MAAGRDCGAKSTGWHADRAFVPFLLGLLNFCL